MSVFLTSTQCALVVAILVAVVTGLCGMISGPGEANGHSGGRLGSGGWDRVCTGPRAARWPSKP